MTSMSHPRSSEALLRSALGVVFVWFGALKLAGGSPVVALLEGTWPRLASPSIFTALGLFEVTAGVLLIAGLWLRPVACAVVAHLLGTFALLFIAPDRAFVGGFPYLSMDGEFVVKNFVLLAVAVTLARVGGRATSFVHAASSALSPTEAPR